MRKAIEIGWATHPPLIQSQLFQLLPTWLAENRTRPFWSVHISIFYRCRRFFWKYAREDIKLKSMRQLTPTQ